MKILSQEQQTALQNDLANLIQKHGLTGGYLVAEARFNGDYEPSDYCIVVNATPPGQRTGIIMESLALQTHAIIKQTSRLGAAPRINDN